ncbi:uncharacterized protein LOC133189879 [Saccostrea echinata]|uniref:uncharacterized protein LOC133189879 n=1 Tax=Saccostrea echinata TaxID=191078 RepID=UPI002A7FC2C9|nr:uncharacterized protein LOC133189879 [Saccostrea echinata]
MTQHKVYMNQIHCSSLLCELAQMWRNQALCDAIIKAGSITAKAHRLVLVAACPMLKSMESASVGSHLEIRLASDIKEESINTFLQYLYEGCMVLTEDNYKDIEKIGRILQVDSVIKCCSDFYKCLNSSSQYKYDYYDHVEFKHVRQTDMLKFSEKSNKRSMDSKNTSQGGKRQKVLNSDSPSFGANPKTDDLPGPPNFNSPKDHNRPFKIGPASMSRRPNGGVDVVEDGVQIHHVDKDTSPGSSHVVDTSSAMSVSVASQIQPDINVQVVNIGNTHHTSSPSVISRIPNKPPLSGPFPTETVDNRSDSPIFVAGVGVRGYGATMVPPSKSFAMGSPTMVPVGPAQFPTFVKDTISTSNTEEEVGMKSRSESQSSLTTSPDLSIVKKEPGISTPFVEVQEQGMMMIRRTDTDSEQQEEVSSDLEIEEPPPDDSFTGDPGSEASWIGGQAGENESSTEKGSWHSVETRGPYAVNEEQGGEVKFDRNEMKFDGTDLKFYDEVLPGHRLIRIEGSKKACAYCDIQRLKTKSGWQIKSYFKCLACDIPLCKSDKECFLRYHELRLEQPNVPPKELHKRLKTKNKPLLLHNVTPSQMKSSNTSSPSPNISIEESVTTADIIRAHLSPSDFSEQNPAPPLLTPYLYNTSNVPPLDIDSPEHSNSGTPEKLDTLPQVNKKEEKQTPKAGITRKSRKSVKTKPMKIVFNEEENDALGSDDSEFRKTQRPGLLKKEKSSPISLPFTEQNIVESHFTITLNNENSPGITGTSENQPNLEPVPSDNVSNVDTKDMCMKDDEGQIHRLVSNPGHKALTCVYCKMTGNKTACGWHIKCYYRCNDLSNYMELVMRNQSRKGGNSRLNPRLQEDEGFTQYLLSGTLEIPASDWTVDPAHRLVSTDERKLRPCYYCSLTKVKTKSGWFLYFALITEVVEPLAVRGFFCSDKSLSFPYKEGSVSNNAVYATGGLPLVFVIVTAYNVIPLKKLYRIWVSYAFGISSIYFFMNVVKLFYGELRPNFFEACKPVWPNMNCSSYVTDFNCTGSNRKAAIESMRSFPSSHAGITIFGMLYLIIFTQEVFMNRRKQYHLGWAIFQWAGFLWAVYAGMSRITDNKHHIQDVIGGYIIGGATSYWVAYYWSGLGEIGNPRPEKDGKAQNHLITHCSCQNGITVGKPKES